MPPTILVVDDEPEKVALFQGQADVTVSVVHPQDLEKKDLVSANAILVDQVLNNWTLDPTPSFSCTPTDGLALAAIIRSHLRSLDSGAPTAVCLYSGALSTLVDEVEPQEHLVARAFGLEWAFPKQPRAEMPTIDVQVASLARAVEVLPRSWTADDPDQLAEQLTALLGLGDQAWLAGAWGEVERSRPPMHRLSAWTDGLAVLRWLLHRILPYPCFLLSLPLLALRLRADVTWLRTALGSSEALRTAFAPADYQGALAGFLGARWWSAGVDHQIRDVLGDGSGSYKSLHDWLAKTSGLDFVPLATPEPVPTYDETGRFQSLEPMRSCVRIQLDDWPAFADDSWTRADTALETPALRRLVLAADMNVLESKEP